MWVYWSPRPYNSCCDTPIATCARTRTALVASRPCFIIQCPFFARNGASLGCARRTPTVLPFRRGTHEAVVVVAFYVPEGAVTPSSPPPPTHTYIAISSVYTNASNVASTHSSINKYSWQGEGENRNFYSLLLSLHFFLLLCKSPVHVTP